jgi:hypothetical protein
LISAVRWSGTGRRQSKKIKHIDGPPGRRARDAGWRSKRNTWPAGAHIRRRSSRNGWSLIRKLGS